jgi:hypothetical protein
MATVLGNGTASRRSEVLREREEDGSASLEDEPLDEEPPSRERLDGLAEEEEPDRLLLEGFEADLDEDISFDLYLVLLGYRRWRVRQLVLASLLSPYHRCRVSLRANLKQEPETNAELIPKGCPGGSRGVTS